jgi:helix-turn-helix protein
VREPYPVALVPLLPQFLNRRRAKADFPLRAMEKLGLDRPAYFFAMDLGIQDPRGARPEDIGNSTYRTTDEALRISAAAGESAGLLVWMDGRWSLTDKGTSAVGELRRAIDAHYASLAPIASDELTRLAALLDAACHAAASSTEPATREHTPRGARYRWREPSSPMARLDAAIYGLWQIRDDCHVQAWRDAGLTGPALDVLTRIWHREAATEDELAGMGKIPTQRPEDVRAAVRSLRTAGLLTGGPGLGLSPNGTATRERIEAETDRYFFAPWPDAVGQQADWLTERLAEVNAALA